MKTSRDGLQIQLASSKDFESIWPILQNVIIRGDTYTFARDTSAEEAHAYWMQPGAWTYIAFLDGLVVGSYILKPNQPGLGSHVANAAFIIGENFRGQGLGKRLAEHALSEAKQKGFRAMQFNFVVSTNKSAIALWEQLGFTIIGKVPEAFDHPEFGFVDALIMHRLLEPPGPGPDG